jgi:hypothetical protein
MLDKKIIDRHWSTLPVFPPMAFGVKVLNFRVVSDTDQNDKDKSLSWKTDFKYRPKTTLTRTYGISK